MSAKKETTPLEALIARAIMGAVVWAILQYAIGIPQRWAIALAFVIWCSYGATASVERAMKASR